MFFSYKTDKTTFFETTVHLLPPPAGGVAGPTQSQLPLYVAEKYFLQ